MSWIKYPTVKLTTVYGPVSAAFTDGSHVAVNVEAHINDDKPALVFRGQDYIGMVHLFKNAAGEWATRDGSDVSLSKRPQWVDAPRTHAALMVQAMADAVREYIESDPDVLRRAAYSHANNDYDREAENLEKVRADLEAIEARMAVASALMWANAPDSDA